MDEGLGRPSAGSQVSSAAEYLYQQTFYWIQLRASQWPMMQSITYSTVGSVVLPVRSVVDTDACTAAPPGPRGILFKRSILTRSTTSSWSTNTVVGVAALTLNSPSDFGSNLMAGPLRPYVASESPFRYSSRGEGVGPHRCSP